MLLFWMLRYRTRLLISAVTALLLAMVVLYWTTASSFTDFGVLWHRFCGCPLDPRDTRVLLNAPAAIAVLLGLVVGFPIPGIGQPAAGGGLTPYRPETGYLLTRPMRRSTALLAPFVLTGLAVAIMPGAALLLLYAWLHAVHAASLDHIIGLLQLVPAGAALGAHPSFFRLLVADGLPQRYIAAVSAGLFIVVLMTAQRWFMLSSNAWLKFASVLPAFIFALPAISLMDKPLLREIMALSASNLVPPSWTDITIHFALAFGLIYGCWRILCSLEL